MSLGFGFTGTTAAKGTCSKGARRSGAARTDKFHHLKMQVKVFLEKERSVSHYVDKVDLLEAFLYYCKLELELVQEKNAAGFEDKPKQKKDEEMYDEDTPYKKNESPHQLLQKAVSGDFEEQIAAGFEGLRSSQEHVKGMSQKELEEWEKELNDMIERLKNSDKCRDRFTERLLRCIGGKLMQPGRMSTLSMEEEEAGLKAKWKEFDAAMRLAAFRSKEVANPAGYMQQGQNVFLGVQTRSQYIHTYDWRAFLALRHHLSATA